MELLPSSITLRKKGKSKRKSKKGAKNKATTPKAMPPAFKNETPFFWKTVDVFDSPVPGNEDWLWHEANAAESKEEVPELDTKEPEGEETEYNESELGEGSNDDADPEDSEDRAFLKESYEETSRDDCPMTDEEEFEDSNDPDYAPTDGGESSDTLSEDEPPRERRLPKKKTPEAKRTGAGDPDEPDPSDDSGDDSGDSSGHGDSDGQTPRRSGNRSHRNKLSKRQRRRRRSYVDRRHAAATAAVLYKPPDEKKNPPPILKHGDPESRKEFQPKYTAYVTKHKSDQRSVPPIHRVLPRAVVECIEPALLMQICRLELQRSTAPNDLRM